MLLEVKGDRLKRRMREIFKSGSARVVGLAGQNGLKIYPAGVDCPIVLVETLIEQPSLPFWGEAMFFARWGQDDDVVFRMKS